MKLKEKISEDLDEVERVINELEKKSCVRSLILMEDTPQGKSYRMFSKTLADTISFTPILEVVVKRNKKFIEEKFFAYENDMTKKEIIKMDYMG